MERLIYGDTDLYYVDLKEGDVCPKCGKELRPIPFFGGDYSCVHKKLERSVMDDNKIETTAHGNWVKCWGGYCSCCAEKYLNDSDRKFDAFLSSMKKLSIFMIMAIAGFVGLAGTGVLPFQLLLFVGLFGMMPYSIITIANFANYKSQKKYVEPSMEELENTLVEACNSRYNRGAVMGLIGKDMFFTPESVLIEE
jgi:hypothetical protein